MGDAKPTVVVTGISGNLGTRLLPQLLDFDVIGVDIAPPTTNLPLRFERMDLGAEESCRQLFLLMRDSHASAVVHLAFVLDPVRTGVLDLDRMWQINVAGTARVMEAVTEANHESAIVDKFIFTSSVAAYGPNLPGAVTEEHPLGAYSLPYAIHKMEADKVVHAFGGRGNLCDGNRRSVAGENSIFLHNAIQRRKHFSLLFYVFDDGFNNDVAIGKILKRSRAKQTIASLFLLLGSNRAFVGKAFERFLDRCESFLQQLF